MKKILKTAIVAVGVLLLVFVAFSAYMVYRVSNQDHLGRWAVVSGANLSTDEKLDYCILLDDCLTRTLYRDGKPVDVCQYRTSVKGDEITLYHPDGSLYRTYEMSFDGDGADRHMTWRYGVETVRFRRGTPEIPSISAGQRSILPDPYVPYRMTAEGGATFDIQFFANSLYCLDGKIDLCRFIGRDSLVLRHGDRSQIKFLSENELYWYLDGKPYLMRLEPQPAVKNQPLTVPPPQTAQTPAAKSGDVSPKARYKVGDLVDIDGARGVVFSVDKTGDHGLMVELHQDTTLYAWSLLPVDRLVKNPLVSSSGEYNFRVVQNISGWREKFPAFQACADRGPGWFLPSFKEMNTLTDNREAVNAALKACGGDILMPRHVGIQIYRRNYWTSNSLSLNKALVIQCHSLYVQEGKWVTAPVNGTAGRFNVRAVHRF